MSKVIPILVLAALALAVGVAISAYGRRLHLAASRRTLYSMAARITFAAVILSVLYGIIA